MSFYLSTRSMNNMGMVDARLVEVAVRAIQITRVDFGIPNDGGFRTAETQHGLFLKGASNCDGYIKKSRHQSGKALDFYAYVAGKASYDTFHMAMVACALLQSACELGYTIEWGGLWVLFPDMPHIQLTD